jgi:fluoride exporter
MLVSIIAISAGAAAGALLRWMVSIAMNPLLVVPLGTLAVNLAGGYLIGVAMAFFGLRADLDPVWRLFIITGFLGGLTTFSTFSAEVIELLNGGHLGWAGVTIASHVLGSLAMTLLGIGTVQVLR